jgi:hypothetical protein
VVVRTVVSEVEAALTVLRALEVWAEYRLVATGAAAGVAVLV